MSNCCIGHYGARPTRSTSRVARRSRPVHVAGWAGIAAWVVTGIATFRSCVVDFGGAVTSRAWDQPLRPFFGYHGGKWRDTPRHYPAPLHDTVVEPFAGSAGYSVRFRWKKVVLCELDPIVAGVWRFLKRAKPEDILSLPDLEPEESVDDLEIEDEAKWLIGFWLNRGVASPRKSPSRWMRERIRPGSFWGERVRNTIASQLHHLERWEIHECSYQECPVTGEATWFIDPPYFATGTNYRHDCSQIDYDHLARWCASRRGQVIVCENEGASWLDFEPLGHSRTTRRGCTSAEVWWYRESNLGPPRRAPEKAATP